MTTNKTKKAGVEPVLQFCDVLVEKKKETTPTGLEKETETSQEKRKAKKREREHETRDRLTSRSTRTPSGIKRRTRIETGNVYDGKTGIIF